MEKGQKIFEIKKLKKKIYLNFKIIFFLGFLSLINSIDTMIAMKKIEQVSLTSSSYFPDRVASPHTTSPFFTRSSQMAFPIGELAPVTTATRPSHRLMPRSLFSCQLIGISCSPPSLSMVHNKQITIKSQNVILHLFFKSRENSRIKILQELMNILICTATSLDVECERKKKGKGRRNENSHSISKDSQKRVRRFIIIYL